MSTEWPFDSREVVVRGATFTVRQLSYDEMAAVLKLPREDQNLAVAKVGASNGTGEPLGETLHGMPWSMVIELIRAVGDINSVALNNEDGSPKD